MIKLIVNNEEYECNYKKELQCDEATINEDLKRQPSLFAFYAVLVEKADADYRNEKVTFAILEATIAGELRNTETKLTEKKLESIIVLNESYQKGLIGVNKKRENLGVLKAIANSFMQRKDMLITLASMMRVQCDPDIHLNKQKFNN